MSRTGNLLFPDNKDDGWVTSIIKALREEKPKDDAPVTDDIEDPVAIEAEAAFAETAADTTVRDAIETAAWTPMASLALPPWRRSKKSFSYSFASMASQICASRLTPSKRLIS